MYNTPYTPPPAAPSHYVVPAARRYPMLRFIAATTIASGWATLAVSVIMALMIFAAPTFPTPSAAAAPSPFGSPGPTGSSAPDPTAILLPLLAGLKTISALMTIGTGIGFCLAQLAGGLLIYVFIDIEENTRLGTQAMSAITRRMGVG